MPRRADGGITEAMESNDLYDLSLSQLADLLGGTGRAKQIWKIIREGGDPFAPGIFAPRTAERLTRLCQPSEIAITSRTVAADDTRKLLLFLADGQAIETVIIPGAGRTTVCVSTQVGCARQCEFCATATLGLRRSLRVGEIIAQVVLAGREATAAAMPPLRNVVFMGMGEPLDNLDATLRAVDLLVDPHHLQIAPRHITISTVGTSPRAIQRLSETPARLAWSVHAVDDALRRRLVPTTKHPMVELRQAFLDAIAPRNAHLFVEIALIDGVNDDTDHADALADFLEPFLPEVRVNLLPINPIGSDLSPAPRAHALTFRQILRERGYFCAIRRPRGADAVAACGQLVAEQKQTR